MLGTHGTGDDGLCPVGLSTLGAVEQVGVHTFGIHNNLLTG